MRTLTTGAGSAPTVLCHATGFCGAVLEPLARGLRDAWAVAPDLRGHGTNQIPADGDLDWTNWADDALAAVDRLRAMDGAPQGPVCGFGHSGGGAALILAERKRPGTFRALLLYEPVVFPPGALDGRLRDNPLSDVARQRRPDFPSRDAAYRNFASKRPMNAFDPEVLHAYIDEGFQARPDGSVTLRCRPENEARMYQMAGVSGAWDALERVRCPVVVARGAVTNDEPSHFADAVADALPDGTLEVFEHLGHFGPLEAPQEVADAFQRLIDRT